MLFRGGDPHRPGDGTWWFTPGGGVDPGETTEEAARRELWEETGQSDVEWGGLVARREVTFLFMGATYLSREDFFVAHTASLDVDPGGLTPLEEEAMQDRRWFDATSIRRLTEPVYPLELCTVLSRLSVHDYPPEPWSWS